jgi:hypothetical protein
MSVAMAFSRVGSLSFVCPIRPHDKHPRLHAARLCGARVLFAYEAVVTVIAGGLLLDLRYGRWPQAVLTGRSSISAACRSRSRFATGSPARSAIRR